MVAETDQATELVYREKETELVGAERALQTSGRESQSIEAKVNFAKSQLAKLKKQAAG